MSNALRDATQAYWKSSRAYNQHPDAEDATVGDVLTILSNVITAYNYNPRPLSRQAARLQEVIIATGRKRRITKKQILMTIKDGPNVLAFARPVKKQRRAKRAQQAASA